MHSIGYVGLAYAAVAVGYSLVLVRRYRRRSADGTWRAPMTPGDCLGIALIGAAWFVTTLLWLRKKLYDVLPSWMYDDIEEDEYVGRHRKTLIRMTRIGGEAHGETRYVPGRAG